MGVKGPETLGRLPVSIMLYFADVDAMVKQVAAAGREDRPPSSKIDSILTEVESSATLLAINGPSRRTRKTVSPEEMKVRLAAMMKSKKQAGRSR